MRKFLDELNLQNEYLYEEDKCGRQKLFEEQIQNYGFDVRETWDMRYTFFVWLYERLSLYNGVKAIDASFHQITITTDFEETHNLQYWIDTLLQLVIYILKNYNRVDKTLDEKMEHAVNIFVAIIGYLWW